MSVELRWASQCRGGDIRVAKTQAIDIVVAKLDCRQDWIRSTEEK